MLRLSPLGDHRDDQHNFHIFFFLPSLPHCAPHANDSIISFVTQEKSSVEVLIINFMRVRWVNSNSPHIYCYCSIASNTFLLAGQWKTTNLERKVDFALFVEWNVCWGGEWSIGSCCDRWMLVGGRFLVLKLPGNFLIPEAAVGGSLSSSWLPKHFKVAFYC